jgi:glycosyltransferase involved in cell wall biosynthesis
MTTVSVILPTFNRARWLPHAIESVLRQRYRDFELIVVDDGSVDETSDVLKRYDSTLTCISQANAGVAAARNRGIVRARGSWLAFIDSDDEWHTDYLQSQMKHLQGQPDLVMLLANCNLRGHAGPHTTYFSLNGVDAVLHSPGAPESISTTLRRLERGFELVVEHPPWQLGATLMRRDAVMRSGLFHERLTLSEDLDLIARMTLQGPAALVCEPRVDVHRRPADLWSLSDPISLGPWRSLLANEKVYARLSRWPGLTQKERRTVKRICSQNRRAIAHQFALQGQNFQGRAWYLRSLWQSPSWTSLAATTSACLPAPLHRRVLRWSRQWRRQSRQRTPLEGTS